MKKQIWSSAFLICCLMMLLLMTNPLPAQATPETDAHVVSTSDGVIRDVPTEQKLIALSFDDGPNPIYTPQVLDLLKQYDAKATFFVIGSRVSKYANLVQRESAEGHEVANHSFKHVLRRLPESEFQEDLARAQEAIYSATGQEAHLFRPPGGYYNDKIVHTAKQAGFATVLWNRDPRDWSRPGVNKIVKSVLSNAHNGDIVLLHDHGKDRSQTVKALEVLLPELQKQGFHCVTISELLKQKVQKKPANLPVLP